MIILMSKNNTSLPSLTFTHLKELKRYISFARAIKIMGRKGHNIYVQIRGNLRSRNKEWRNPKYFTYSGKCGLQNFDRFECRVVHVKLRKLFKIMQMSFKITFSPLKPGFGIGRKARSGRRKLPCGIAVLLKGHLSEFYKHLRSKSS